MEDVRGGMLKRVYGRGERGIEVCNGDGDVDMHQYSDAMKRNMIQK